jgi:hypothetical protein
MASLFYWYNKFFDGDNSLLLNRAFSIISISLIKRVYDKKKAGSRRKTGNRRPRDGGQFLNQKEVKNCKTSRRMVDKRIKKEASPTMGIAPYSNPLIEGLATHDSYYHAPEF